MINLSRIVYVNCMSKRMERFFFLVACSKCVGTEGHTSHGLGHLVDRNGAVVKDKGVMHLPYPLEAISDQLRLCKVALVTWLYGYAGRVH